MTNDNASGGLTAAMYWATTAKGFGADKPPARSGIRPDLIPMSSWGSSLANLLTRASWDSIRQPVLRATNACRVCCDLTAPLECHEIWSYALPPPDAVPGTVGVQRLLGLAALCEDCHAMFHMGRARVIGTFQLVKQRLMRVNQWSQAEFTAYEVEQEELGEKRSAVSWALDVSHLAGCPRLVIKSTWSLHAEGYLVGPVVYHDDPGFSVILGASYCVGGEVISATPTDEAMEGLCPEQGDFTFAERMNRL